MLKVNMKIIHEIKNIKRHTRKENGKLFADDTNLFYTHSDLQHLEQNVYRELSEISLWLRTNKLSLDIAKKHLVIFHPHQKKQFLEH